MAGTAATTTTTTTTTAPSSATATVTSAEDQGGDGSDGGDGGGSDGESDGGDGGGESGGGSSLAGRMYREEAWGCLVKANLIEGARRTPHQPQTEAASTQMYTQVFGPTFWPAGVGSTDTSPIFIIGLMRSVGARVELGLVS